MRHRPTRTPIEALRRHRESMSNGTLSGRIGQARPIFPAPEVFESVIDGETVADDEDKVKFFNESFLSRGSSAQTISLRYMPLSHSEHVYVGGMYLSNRFWTRTDQTITVTNPDGVIGDVITVEYAYVSSAPAAPADFFVAVPVGISNVVGNQSAISLPAGTQSGDLMVLVMGAVGSFATASSSDSRFVDSQLLPTGDGVARAYWGFADSSGSAVSISLGGIVASAGSLAVFKGGGQYVSETMVAWGGAAAAIPGVDAAISLLVNIAPSNSNLPGFPATDYTLVGGASQVQAIVSVGYWNGPGTAPATTFNNSQFGGIILGVDR